MPSVAVLLSDPAAQLLAGAVEVSLLQQLVQPLLLPCPTPALDGSRAGQLGAINSQIKAEQRALAVVLADLFRIYRPGLLGQQERKRKSTNGKQLQHL